MGALQLQIHIFRDMWWIVMMLVEILESSSAQNSLSLAKTEQVMLCSLSISPKALQQSKPHPFICF